MKPIVSQHKKYYANYILWGALVYFCSYYFFCVLAETDSWNLGDWLISFEGGVIRRGLIGQLFISASDILSVSPKWVAYATQIGCWVAIYALIFKVFNRIERDKGWFLFLLSPAFLLYPFFDMGAGLRKEILVFAAFSVLCASFAYKRMSSLNIGLSFTLYTLAVFSHEALVVTMPFFLAILWLAQKEKTLSRKAAIACLSLFVISTLAAVAFVLVYPGGAGSADSVCSALIKRGVSSDVCIGAIAYLDNDSKFAVQATLSEISSGKFDFLVRWPFKLMLALLPVFLLRPLDKRLVTFLLLAFIATLPLYVIARDWYRWIFIYVFFTFATVLTYSCFNKLEIRNIHSFLIFLYLTSWSLHSTSGWFSFFNYLITKPSKVFGLSS